jgi:NAD(P)-dependent dehydrogenase (short-subunit alcohol dehydrogenase family)
MTSNNMHNKLVMVTGATAGIGKQTARALQQMGARGDCGSQPTQDGRCDR